MVVTPGLEKLRNKIEYHQKLHQRVTRHKQRCKRYSTPVNNYIPPVSRHSSITPPSAASLNIKPVIGVLPNSAVSPPKKKFLETSGIQEEIEAE